MAGLNKLQLQVFGRKTNPYVDFSGLDIIDIFGLQRTSISVQEDFMWIYRGDGGEAFSRIVSWDSNGAFSDNSPVSGGGGSTFGDIKGNYDWYNTYLIGHITGREIKTNNTNTGVSGGLCAVGGVIVTDPVNGKPCLDMAGNEGRRQYRGTYTELNSGNNWSILDVVSPTVANVLYGLFSNTSNANNTDNYLNTYLDMRTNKLAARARIAGVNYDNTFISQQTTSDQKRVLTTVNSSKEVKSYLNGALQSMTTYSGDYNNNWMRFLQSNTSIGNPFKGLWQLRTLHNSELDSTKIAKLNTQIDTLFGL